MGLVTVDSKPRGDMSAAFKWVLCVINACKNPVCSKSQGGKTSSSFRKLLDMFSSLYTPVVVVVVEWLRHGLLLHICLFASERLWSDETRQWKSWLGAALRKAFDPEKLWRWGILMCTLTTLKETTGQQMSLQEMQT